MKQFFLNLTYVFFSIIGGVVGLFLAAILPAALAAVVWLALFLFGLTLSVKSFVGVILLVGLIRWVFNTAVKRINS